MYKKKWSNSALIARDTNDAISSSEGFYTIHIHTSDGKHYHLKWIKQ